MVSFWVPNLFLFRKWFQNSSLGQYFLQSWDGNFKLHLPIRLWSPGLHHCSFTIERCSFPFWLWSPGLCYCSCVTEGWNSWFQHHEGHSEVTMAEILHSLLQVVLHWHVFQVQFCYTEFLVSTHATLFMMHHMYFLFSFSPPLPSLSSDPKTLLCVFNLFLDPFLACMASYTLTFSS